jgi:hypothetical protein
MNLQIKLLPPLAAAICSCAVQLPDEVPTTYSRWPILTEEGAGDERKVVPWPTSHYTDLSPLTQILSEEDTPLRKLATHAAARCEQKMGGLRASMKQARDTRHGMAITAGSVSAAGGFTATTLAAVQASREPEDKSTGLDVGTIVTAGVAVVGAIVGIVSPFIAEPETVRVRHTQASKWYSRAESAAVILSGLTPKSPEYQAQLLVVVTNLQGCASDEDPPPIAPAAKSEESVLKNLADGAQTLAAAKARCTVNESEYMVNCSTNCAKGDAAKRSECERGCPQDAEARMRACMDAAPIPGP